jgi:hypothetical protein
VLSLLDFSSCGGEAIFLEARPIVLMIFRPFLTLFPLHHTINRMKLLVAWQIISPFCWTIILRGNHPGTMRPLETETARNSLFWNILQATSLL